MSEYIRKEDAVDAMGKAQWAKDRIEEIEPADVAPVVRCRDCTHWQHGLIGMGCYWDSDYPHEENDFCSRGERSEKHEQNSMGAGPD